MFRDSESRRLAIVTGTTSGIGAALARILLQRGWVVVGVGRRSSEIEHPRYRHLILDLSDVRAVTSSFEADVAPLFVDRRWERVGLVNNAASSELLAAVEHIDPVALLRLYALNTASPVWLMGFVLREGPRDAALRIVNVSSGAAVAAFPGLAAYSSSKAALRMAGMVLAAELDSPLRSRPAPGDAAILSYQPGVVDTPMQQIARSQDLEKFPWVQMFQNFTARGLLVKPEAPATEIVTFLESSVQPRLAECRLQA
jgi:benzil reductase ((S)-benzoin forming)